MPVEYSKEYTTTANISAGATSTEEFVSEADQYASAPFDQLTVTNSDSVNLRINLDGNTARAYTCPPGYFSFRDLKFKTFTISNVSSAGDHTAGKVKLLVENTKFKRRD